MQVFISYSAADRGVAEEIYLALVGAGYDVFFDKDALPPGNSFHQRIERAIQAADLLVFLISPSSVASGSYALTELKFARAKWKHPKGRVLPVRLHNTPWDDMPPYLKSVGALEPTGNTAAEVLSEVRSMRSRVWRPDWRQVLGGVIGIAVLSGAAWAVNAGWIKWKTPTPISPVAEQTPPGPTASGTEQAGATAAQTGASGAGAKCYDVTFTDYSKNPPVFSTVKRCDN